MNSRLAELDRFYHRRMALSLPLAGSVLLVFLALAPPSVILAPDLRVAMRGPLEVLPELDIIPDEESEQHLTAAPPATRPTDFVAVDLDYATDPVAPPRPVPTPAPVPEAPEDVVLQEVSDLQDVQQAILTTGHPVLAQADYEVIRWERPVYPREAVQAGIQGEVEVMMLVDVHGRVSQTYVLNPNRHPILEHAVTEAINKSLFRPYLVDGKPTPFWIRVPFLFRLVS